MDMPRCVGRREVAFHVVTVTVGTRHLACGGVLAFPGTEIAPTSRPELRQGYG
jgi:hypothetical protein